jgi:hypothetical protein
MRGFAFDRRGPDRVAGSVSGRAAFLDSADVVL